MDTLKVKKALTLSRIEQANPGKTELAYVTSVHLPTMTFFAQLCKFPIQELTQFELDLESFCGKVISKREAGELKCCVPSKIRQGDIYSAKYPGNQSWYRGVVIHEDPADENKCSILFLDYGNIDSISLEDIVQIDADELPIMRRQPFGISCFLKDSDKCDDEEAIRLLNSLKHSYVMIKVLEKQSSVQWMVDIPMVAYNTPFWNKFDPSLTRAHNNRAGRRNAADNCKGVDLSASDEEVVASALGG